MSLVLDGWVVATRGSKLAQIMSIADAEPLGSPLFLTHFGVMLVAALGGWLLFGLAEFPVACSVYMALLTVEKWRARRAARAGDASQYYAVLGLLLLRATAYNVIVLLVWRVDGDVFKMTALALLVAATINIMVFHATHRAIMACVVVPIALCFALIAAMIGVEEGLSVTSLAALIAFFCLLPYFGLALRAANAKWRELGDAKRALAQSRRLDAVGQVATGVSHDFNNVLSVISGNLSLLENARSDAERAESIKTMRDAVEGGASLSHQLLAIGKQLTPVPEPVLLDDVMHKFSKFCEKVLPASIAVDFKRDAGAPTVFLDPNLFQSVLLNVVLNAKAAMPEGGLLEITYGCLGGAAGQPIGGAGPGDLAFVSIRDTGRGMSPEAVERAFEPFFSTRTSEGGTGLGLPMVKGFMEQSQGSVTLDSREGVGTKVTLLLPVSDPLPMPARQTPEPAACGTVEAATGILLVEDNSELRKLLQVSLERRGHDVVSFETGDEAADFLKTGRKAGLVLCDFDLPGRYQGDDLLHLAKSLDDKTRFILMSGFAPRARFSGTDILEKADLFLSKPFQLDRIATQIDELLSSKTAALRP